MISLICQAITFLIGYLLFGWIGGFLFYCFACLFVALATALIPMRYCVYVLVGKLHNEHVFSHASDHRFHISARFYAGFYEKMYDTVCIVDQPVNKLLKDCKS